LGTWKNTAAWNRPAYDITLIKPNSGAIGNSVYVGGNTASASLTIKEARASPGVGRYVAASGANSGVHVLEISVKNPGVTFNGVKLAGHVATVASNGVAGATGDSGGPVTFTDSGGITYGVGSIVSAYDYSIIPCGSTTLAHGGTCYSTLIYSSLTGILDNFNAVVGN
jgi:hypothetical protein